MIHIKTDGLLFHTFLFLQLVPFFVPEGLYVLSHGLYMLIYFYWQYFVFLFILVRFLLKVWLGHSPSILFYVVAMFYLALGLISLFRTGHIGSWLQQYTICLVVAMFLDLERTHLVQVVRVGLIISAFWLCLNMLLILRYPDGMYVSEATNYWKNWILGYKSSIQYIILPCVCFSWMEHVYYKRKLLFPLTAALSVLEAFRSGNAMLTIGIIMLLVIYLFRLGWFYNIFNIRLYYGIVVALNIIFVGFLTWFGSLSVTQQVLDSFDKDLTLSGRATIIWPLTLKKIIEHPILGHGVVNSLKRADSYHFDAAIHAHNQFLEIAYLGGFVVFLLFAFILLIVGRKLYRNRKRESAQIISACIFILLAMVVVEVFTRNVGGPVWLVLFLGYYCKSLDKQYQRKIPHNIKQRYGSAVGRLIAGLR